MDLSTEIRSIIYDIAGIGAMLISLLLNLFYGKHFGLSKKQSIIISAANIFFIFMLVTHAWAEVDQWIFGIGSRAAFRSSLLIPLLSVAFAKIIKKNVGMLVDYLAPSFFLAHAVASVGCVFVGCCTGCEWHWGIVSPKTGAVVFPLQLFIIVFSSLIGIFGYMYNKKHEYKSGGKTYAWAMIFYGICRFGVEFFSDDLRIFMGLSLYSVYSLLMILFGLLGLYFADRKTSPLTIAEAATS